MLREHPGEQHRQGGIGQGGAQPPGGVRIQPPLHLRDGEAELLAAHGLAHDRHGIVQCARIGELRVQQRDRVGGRAIRV